MRGCIRNGARVMAILTVILGLSACKPARPTGRIADSVVQVARPEKARDWVVARVGQREVTFGELEDVLESLPVFVRMRYQAPERRRDFLEAYVQFLVLGLAAEAEGYGDDPVVLERLKGDLVDRFLQERVDLKVKTTDIPEAQVQAYFEAHPFEFKAPERKRIRHILLGDRPTAEKIAFRVRRTLEDVTGDPREAFGQFAQRHSIDAATKGRGGELGLFPRLGDDGVDAPQAVADAAMSLTEPFQVSPVVEAPDGFHVLFLSGVMPPIDQTLDQARPRIVERLMDEERGRLREALLADLSRRAEVKVDEAVAARVVAEVQAEAAKARAAGSKAALSAEGGVP